MNKNFFQLFPLINCTVIKNGLQFTFSSLFHFSVGTNNVTRSEQDGLKTIQYIMKERVVLIGFFNISKTITFQVNVTVMEENAVIRNRMDVMGKTFQVTQHWYLTDSKKGNKDETLLKDHFEFTTVRLLSRFAKKEASAAHNTMLKSIRQHFIDITET